MPSEKEKGSTGDCSVRSANHRERRAGNREENSTVKEKSGTSLAHPGRKRRSLSLTTMNQKQISEVPNPGDDFTYIAQTVPRGGAMNTDVQGGANFSILGMPGTVIFIRWMG